MNTEASKMTTLCTPRDPVCGAFTCYLSSDTRIEEMNWLGRGNAGEREAVRAVLFKVKQGRKEGDKGKREEGGKGRKERRKMKEKRERRERRREGYTGLFHYHKALPPASPGSYSAPSALPSQISGSHSVSFTPIILKTDNFYCKEKNSHIYLFMYTCK